jgi:TRAP-type mannitol/chloroaromatic compound transport system substrate-binding protein
MSLHHRFAILTTLTLALTLGACSEKTTETQAVAPQKSVTLKLAETWGPNYPIFGDVTKNLAAMVDKMSSGRLKITIDSANKHQSPFGIFDLVKSGQYDMGHSGSYYWKGKIPATMFFTTMPFSMTAPEQLAWFYFGGGMELMNELYNQHNLMSFPGGNTGNQMAGWFKKEINSVADLQGLKIRIPGFAGEVLAKLGAAPINIPPGELFTSLERGAIDAVEWVGPSLDIRMGFHKIAPFYYTGWHEPGAELQFLVNKKVWDELPADLQEILRVAMRTAAYDMYAQSMHESSEHWATMQQEFPNIQVRSFSPEIMTALRKANDELLQETSAADPFSAKVLKSQQDYLKKIRVWTEMSDKAYLDSTKVN